MTARYWFRNGDRRFPFAWETEDQPSARWHADGRGPACYLADTSDGAWAEFLRHEEITDPDDLPGISRRVWAVEVDDEVVAGAVPPVLPSSVTRGGTWSYPRCQAAADAVRAAGATALVSASAALEPGGAGGQVLDAGLVEAEGRDGRVLVLFGAPRGLRGWAVVDEGRPTERVLRRTAPLG